MKKILIFAVLLTSGIFTSCSEDDNGRFANDPQSGWVQFRNASTVNVLFSEGGTISVPVKLSAPVNTDGLEVTYSITNIVGSTTGVVSADNVVRFDGNVESNIVMNLLGSSLAETIEFDVTLTATSRSNVTVGLTEEGTALKPIVKRIKICSNQFSTSYTGSSQATIDGAPAFENWSPTITAVPGSTNTFQYDTLWGSGLVPLLTGNPALNTFLYPGFLTINADNSVTVVGINDPAFPNRYPGGSGTYDPCTKVITYRLSQGLFTNPFQVDVTLTPN